MSRNWAARVQSHSRWGRGGILGNNLQPSGRQVEGVSHSSFAWCNQFGKDMWIDKFSAEKRGQGISICNIWTVSAPKGPIVLQIGPNPDFEFEYWPATLDTILLNLIRKTVRGKSPCIRINGLPGHHVPNIIYVLSNLAADSIFSLATNNKITGRLENPHHCEEKQKVSEKLSQLPHLIKWTTVKVV